jgi:hypothetical protein
MREAASGSSNADGVWQKVEEIMKEKECNKDI